MGAVQFYIPIDTTRIEYVSYTIGTIPITVAFDQVNLRLNFIWTGTFGPANINGTLANLNFSFKGGNAALNITGVEFATYSFVPVNPAYDHGSVNPVPLLTYYVNGSVLASGDGLSWGTALKKISEAANKPLKGGENVLIMPGTYNDTLVIKSNGTEIVPLTFNVSVSDTNKITFPSSADLGCIDLAGYPGRYYAYVFRSWKGNNGVYKITQVNKTAKYVIVEGAEFVTESGAPADSSLLQASIALPVVYQKYSANPQAERVILSSSGISGERATVHIGKIISAGDFNVNAANYNILDGIDVTGADQVGVRIQNSKNNVFRNGRVYELDSIAFLISGNTAKPANNNLILGNTIYNTSRKALKVGIQAETSPNNRANLNHFKNNEVYSTTAGSFINYINAVDICRFTGYTVLEGNTFRNFNLKNINRGAIEVRNNVRRFLAYGNYLKNVGRINTGIHGLFYLQHSGNNNKVFNNVLADSAAVDNDLFAFWANNATGTATGGLIAYNTVHRVDNGFRLESAAAGVDVTIKNNIMNLDPISPDHFNTTGSGLYSVSYNCYSTIPAAYAGETGRLVTDPLFFQPSYFLSPYGLTLTSGSQCLGTGNPVSGISVDYRKRPRSASSPSRGAYEGVLSDVYWTGARDINWHDYRNWDILMVPASGFQIIIPDRANDPVISSSNVTVKTLELLPAAQIRINAPRILTLTN